MFKNVQMRMRHKLWLLLACLLVLLVSSAQMLHACWAAISLEDFIKDKQIIIVGEIQRITSDPKSQPAENTAFIKVEKIYRRWLPCHQLKIGDEVSFNEPARGGNRRASTDIDYFKGQRGIWILHYENGKGFAGHPMSVLEVGEETKIAAIVGEQAKQRALRAKLSVKK